MSSIPVTIQYTGRDGFDEKNYPIEDWHRAAIQSIQDKLNLPVSTIWYYYATLQGRIFQYISTRRHSRLYSRLVADHLHFLFNLDGFRWIESRENGCGFAVGLEHVQPKPTEVACPMCAKGVRSMTDEERVEFVGELMGIFCLHCGQLTGGQTCHCTNDD